jgi:hypothetical protein
MSNNCFRVIAVWLAATLTGGTALAEEKTPADRPVRDSSAVQAQPQIVVKNLTQLSSATQQDYVVSSRVDSMNDRRKFALVTGGLGVTAGAAAVVASLILSHQKSCNFTSPSYQACLDEHAQRDRTSKTLLTVGGAVLVGSLLLAIIIHPSQDEIRDTVRQYNQRNPDAKVAVDPTFQGL